MLPLNAIMTISSMLLLFIWAQMACASYRDGFDGESSSCERITVSMCRDMEYNYTKLPNRLGHTTQEQMELELQQFKPLIHADCSKHVKFFVCSVFTPMCTDQVRSAITSCQVVCEEVRTKCEKILIQFGLSWPDMLNCSQFPKAPLCMDPSGLYKNVAHVDANIGMLSNDVNMHSDLNGQSLDGGAVTPTPVLKSCNDAADMRFDKRSQQFAELWMAIWASICLVVAAFTVFTCWLDPRRFRFPERSIVYLAGCYHVYSWGYIVRLVLHFTSVACQPNGDDSYLIVGGLDNPKCVIIFLIRYYFSLASSIWWVILTFTWFLTAGRKWVHEAIEAWSSFFHLCAWGLPALLSCAVLVTKTVDSSELTGLCFVGNNNPLAMIGFVIAPLVAFLCLGVAFILAGFFGLCSVRQQLRTQGRDIAKLEKLMVKIGIFSVLYVIPAICVIACNVYHLYVLLEDIKRPQVEIYMLKIFMSLIIGITSGMWVSSRKTCLSWQKFLCCGHLRPADVKTVLNNREGTVTLLPPPAHSSLPVAPVAPHSARSAHSYPTDTTNYRKYQPTQQMLASRYHGTTASEASKV